ncbi:MAG: site-specific integrase [Candidatus Heimdallarchaeota archaeon]|nr:site-specific integrase [Candidatus Heimdallarchaeota archaeon]
MDEEGFREFLLKKKLSPRGAEIYIKMLKKYKNFLQKYRDHSNIDFSSIKDLLAFGKWLRDENFQQTMINKYKLALKHYFDFIEKEELAQLTKRGFRR